MQARTRTPPTHALLLLWVCVVPGPLQIRIDIGVGGEGIEAIRMYEKYREKVSVGRAQKKLTPFGIRAVHDMFEYFDR